MRKAAEQREKIISMEGGRVFFGISVPVHFHVGIFKAFGFSYFRFICINDKWDANAREDIA